jgi:hypothetical protein
MLLCCVNYVRYVCHRVVMLDCIKEFTLGFKKKKCTCVASLVIMIGFVTNALYFPAFVIVFRCGL